MTEQEQQIRAFIARPVPDSVEHLHKTMIAEMTTLFFMDKHAVLDHVKQCNEQLNEAIKATPY